MPETDQASVPETDQELARVAGAILAIPELNKKAPKTLRKAVDNVLQGDRTGRYSIQSLSKEDKAHIGTQIEQGLKKDLFDHREGKTLDTVIDGIEVDIKNTIGDNWMIPSEAVGKVCLLVRIDEAARKYSVGVFRANLELLGSPNKDRKRSVLKEGQKSIRWLIEGESFPVSLFLMNPQVGEKVLTHASGQSQVAELFRQERERPIERSDVEVAAAHDGGRQKDLRARVRDAKRKLSGEGLLVLRGSNKPEREEAARRGHPIERDQYICLNIAQSRTGT